MGLSGWRRVPVEPPPESIRGFRAGIWEEWVSGMGRSEYQEAGYPGFQEDGASETRMGFSQRAEAEWQDRPEAGIGSRRRSVGWRCRSLRPVRAFWWNAGVNDSLRRMVEARGLAGRWCSGPGRRSGRGVGR